MNLIFNSFLIFSVFVVTPFYVVCNNDVNSLDDLKSSNQETIEKNIKSITDKIYSNDSKLTIDQRMHIIDLAFHEVLGKRTEFIAQHGELPVDLRDLEKPSFNKKSLRPTKYTILYGTFGAMLGLGVFCATHWGGFGSGSKIIDQTQDISISIPGNIFEYLTPLIGILPGFAAGYGVGGLANLSDDTTDYEDLVAAQKEFESCKDNFVILFNDCLGKETCKNNEIKWSSYKHFLARLGELEEM